MAAARSRMKVPFDLIIQRNHYRSSLDVGLPASCTAWNLFGSGNKFACNKAENLKFVGTKNLPV